MDDMKDSFLPSYISLFLKHRKEPRQLAELWLSLPSPQDEQWLLDRFPMQRLSRVGAALLKHPWPLH